MFLTALKSNSNTVWFNIYIYIYMSENIYISPPLYLESKCTIICINIDGFIFLQAIVEL